MLNINEIIILEKLVAKEIATIHDQKQDETNEKYLDRYDQRIEQLNQIQQQLCLVFKDQEEKINQLLRGSNND